MKDSIARLVRAVGVGASQEASEAVNTIEELINQLMSEEYDDVPNQDTVQILDNFVQGS